MMLMAAHQAQIKHDSWHGREVDLVHGFPFVSEVFFFNTLMLEMCKCANALPPTISYTLLGIYYTL